MLEGRTHQAQLDVPVDDLLRQEEVFVEVLQVEERERWVAGEKGGIVSQRRWGRNSPTNEKQRQRSVTANGRKTQRAPEGDG